MGQSFDASPDEVPPEPLSHEMMATTPPNARTPRSRASGHGFSRGRARLQEEQVGADVDDEQPAVRRAGRQPRCHVSGRGLDGRRDRHGRRAAVARAGRRPQHPARARRRPRASGRRTSSPSRSVIDRQAGIAVAEIEHFSTYVAHAVPVFALRAGRGRLGLRGRARRARAARRRVRRPRGQRRQRPASARPTRWPTCSRP